MSFIPYLQAGLSLYGGIQQRNQQRAQQAALQNLINGIMGQQGNVQGQLLNAITGIQGNAQNYLSVLPGLSGEMRSELAGAGKMAPGAAQQFMQDATDPSSLYGRTGVDSGKLAGGALDYMTNPNATNLAHASPDALQFFANQMKNGIDPTAAQNAQSQLGQQFSQSLNTMRANLAPGQNPFAMERQSQNDLLSASTNLAGNLAERSQGLKMQGAQGMLDTASGLDAQKLNMLAQAFGLGSQYNQTVLGNEQTGANFGQGILDSLGSFANIGNSLNEFGASSLGNLDNSLLQEGEYFSGLGTQVAGNQSNPWASFAQSLGNLPTRGGGGTTPGGPSSGLVTISGGNSMAPSPMQMPTSGTPPMPSFNFNPGNLGLPASQPSSGYAPITLPPNLMQSLYGGSR